MTFVDILLLTSLHAFFAQTVRHEQEDSNDVKFDMSELKTEHSSTIQQVHQSKWEREAEIILLLSFTNLQISYIFKEKKIQKSHLLMNLQIRN